VELPAMPAGGPHELIVGGPKEIRLKDVLVGEVWICSGQSNMAMGLREVLNAQAHIDAADFPRLRVLGLPVESSGLPVDRHSRAVSWHACSPQTSAGFSAVAFFFGRELYRKLDVPVGLIVVATGGTAIEPWVPREGMDITPEVEQWAKSARDADEKYRAALAAWEASGKTNAAPVHAYMGKNKDTRDLGTLFNGSVAPVAGYGLRGMIWYQGESNRGDSSQAYYYFHKALINGWRKVWGREFPFYFVQISALDSWRLDWQIPEIWEGQLMSLRIPNTGMAVIHDLCENLKLIHPQNKEGVGQRLALWALAKTYGVKDLAYSGPIFKSAEVEGKRIRIRFDYTFGGLKSRDGKPLDWFTIAGPDGEFVPAQAAVDGDCVVVWSDKVEKPVAARFAWDERAQPNLVNGAGLPASPFRTIQPW
jgi:sialate O-acetylesterase